MSKFTDMVNFVRPERTRRLTIYAFGHAGDGNLHTEAIVRREVDGEYDRGINATAKIVTHSLELGGTSTGEHGVGLGKRQFMRAEHGASLDLMRSIKRTLDPKGIMNPGKIFPDA